MKKTTILLASLIIGNLSFMGFAQSTKTVTENPQVILGQGPGPVIAGSFDYNKIPQKAKKFIQKHFKGLNVMNVEKDFMENTYEVTMRNGVEIEFDAKGNLTEVEGLNGPLSPDLIKTILPESAYRTLTSKTLHENVRQIDVEKSSYEVEFVKGLNVKEIKFDTKGNVLKIE